MSDRLKSVIQINGGESKNLQLYPRELFINTDGYLIVGNYAADADPTALGAANGIRVGFSTLAGTVSEIHVGSDSNNIFNLYNTASIKKLNFCNEKLEVTPSGFKIQSDITIKGDNTLLPLFKLEGTGFSGGSFNDVDSISVKDTIRISKDKATLHSTNLYGTTLPTTNLSDGQIFFLIES